jgi:hypothetical protein
MSTALQDDLSAEYLRQLAEKARALPLDEQTEYPRGPEGRADIGSDSASESVFDQEGGWRWGKYLHCRAITPTCTN